jgi:hypothetical protein
VSAAGLLKAKAQQEQLSTPREYEETGARADDYGDDQKSG